MNPRKITSMTMLVSMVVLIINSIVLFVEPEGRVAYWAGWKFWGLSKEQWGDQHINVGFLFLIASLLHTYLNWGPIKNYLKNKAKEFSIVSAPFAVAVVLTAVVVVGTLVEVPPFTTVLGIGGHFKEVASDKYGEPPYGHAEVSSLQYFAKKEGLDAEKALQLLQSANFRVNSTKETLLDIARANDVTPKDVYAIIVQAKKEVSVPSSEGMGAPSATGGKLPVDSPAGLGRKNLSELGSLYGVEVKQMIEGLARHDIKADGEMTLHEIGEGAGLDPHQLYEILYDMTNVE